MRPIVVLAALSLVVAAGCSDDKPAASNSSTSGATPTICEALESELSTVTIDVDDDSDGFGRFGLRTPSGLAAGAIQLVVETVDDNPDPVDVTVSSAGEVVFQFVQVAAGVQCATTLDLVAGDYVVAFGSSSKTFTVA